MGFILSLSSFIFNWAWFTTDLIIFWEEILETIPVRCLAQSLTYNEWSINVSSVFISFYGAVAKKKQFFPSCPKPTSIKSFPCWILKQNFESMMTKIIWTGRWHSVVTHFVAQNQMDPHKYLATLPMFGKSAYSEGHCKALVLKWPCAQVLGNIASQDGAGWVLAISTSCLVAWDCGWRLKEQGDSCNRSMESSIEVTVLAFIDQSKLCHT